ncbi:MAG: RHS repeat-associated core domain-containing protein [Rhodopseudomonas sp.]|uniref:RHS repeat-associated core domain-containing protein n=1 Tax=Rhodopseudomonas sp. TaxID=1078 RepID=UPI0039E30836
MTPSATTHYVYDRSGRLLAEASGTGTTQREYVWIDDLPLALFADLDTGTPKQWFVHPDHLNRPTKMTDASQTVVWDAYYWPYGEIRSITGSASNNLRFPGQYYLVESGLHYNWHRHYDPTLGRYTQPDPLDFVDGPSVYEYARSTPNIFVDFNGAAASRPGGPDDPFGLKRGAVGEGGSGGASPVCPIPNTRLSANQSSRWANYDGVTGRGFEDFSKFTGGNYRSVGDGKYVGTGPDGQIVTYYPVSSSTRGPTIQITPSEAGGGVLRGIKVRY